MAIFKSAAVVRDSSGREIGEGALYLHLPRGHDVTQDATGTLSLRRWSPQDGEPVELTIDGGRRLRIATSRSAISDCSRNHILRFRTSWPPTPANG